MNRRRSPEEDDDIRPDEDVEAHDVDDVVEKFDDNEPDLAVDPEPEEVEANLISTGSDPVLRAYLRDISKCRLLSHEEEIILGRRIAHGDQEAWRKLVRSNLRLVVSIAKKFQNRGMPLADLIEEGNLGLLRAAERYNPESGNRFSTYATWWIRQSVRRALSDKGKTVRVPAYMVETIGKWRKAASELSDELGREPSPMEIAEKLKISRRKLAVITRALNANTTTASAAPDLMWMFGDVLPDERIKQPDEDASLRSELEYLTDLFQEIEEREVQVLLMRYGVHSGEPMTLQEIGEKLNLARERVRQIENQALQKLKELAAKRARLNDGDTQ